MERKRRFSSGLPKIIHQRYRWVIVAVLVVALALFLPLLLGGNVWASGHSAGGNDHGKASFERGSHGKGGMTDHRGGAKDVKSKILSDEGDDSDDSDRPDWAQGSRDLNPHSQGGGQPPGAGVMKGDMYGDLYIILRDADGVPILKEINGEYYVQPIAFDENGIVVDENGEPVLLSLNDEGEINDPDYVPMEVEFGRLSVGRAPDKVTDHALEEALSKLTADGAIVEQDLSGHLVADGVAIDSPLENLALYIALMTESPQHQEFFENLIETLDTDKFSLAATLLAAAADKTGAISLDMVAYENVILGIADMTRDDYIDYSSFDYDRAATYDSVNITYYYLPDGATVPELRTGTIFDEVFGGEIYTGDDSAGLADFVQAADDALQLIEFIHTQIHEEVIAAE